MLLYACTSNPDKLAEFVSAGQQSGVPDLIVEPLPGLQNIAPPEEDGATHDENATIKAIYYSSFTQELVFADDSGLEADALGNAPGINSARYAGAGASYAENNALLLRELENSLNRSGRFVCAIALARAGKLETVVHGVVEGEILTAPKGDQGFGYDPLFFYPPFKRSFGELSGPEKLSVSARGRALRQLFSHLR